MALGLWALALVYLDNFLKNEDARAKNRKPKIGKPKAKDQKPKTEDQGLYDQ
jgi:hypothetical protein